MGSTPSSFVTTSLRRSLRQSRMYARGPRATANSRNYDGKLDFTRGLARYDLVADMPVVDLDTNVLVPLHSLRPLYSEAFLRDFR